MYLGIKRKGIHPSWLCHHQGLGFCGKKNDDSKLSAPVKVTIAVEVELISAWSNKNGNDGDEAFEGSAENDTNIS